MRDQVIEAVEILMSGSIDDEAVCQALKNLSHQEIDIERLGTVYNELIQPDVERRRSGSHYTPQSMAAPIVQRTLDPLLECMGETPTSEALLNLKVCDPAMGSGVFLVAACRYLADQIVKAWTREGVAPREEPVTCARRLVAQRCLYGVDINPVAVNLAKFSLWLVTLDREFTFVDHALRCGDALAMELPEMDAVVGNPPFMGGRRVSGALGDDYRDWLKKIHPGSHGNADYCAHFFRRADSLIGAHGTIGLIATNTISQGDTRTTGLQWLVNHGHIIYDATRSRPWPGTAAVTVSVVHLAKGSPAEIFQRSLILDGKPVSAINSRLRSKPERPDPQKLASNASMSFMGSKIYGQGFLLSPEERDELISRNKKNAELIFPYIGGEEVNTSPTQNFHRYVINFGQMSLEEASKWPDLINIVREKVKPERDKLRNNPDGRRLKQYWWQHGRTRPELYQSIQGLPRCLVTSIHSKHLLFSFQKTNQVFSHAMNVFSIDSYSHFCLLQSRIHEAWARLLSSSLEDRLRYAATDCFENFPFPDAPELNENSRLEKIGKQLYETRAKFMVDTDQGLTKTYNSLKDPECTDPQIVELRELHEEMDRAVLAAYGWDDIAVPPYGTSTIPEDFSEEVIDRLFVLNAKQAAKGTPVKAVQRSLILDGKPVSAINSRLRSKPERPDPQTLAANANLSFVGSYVLGMGFTLTPEERDDLIARNKKNAERIFPYIGGEEVNTSPTQNFHRYVINFGQMSLEEASQWPDLINIVRDKVKPERDKLKNNPDGRRRRQYWWHFGRYTPALEEAIQGLPRCLVTACVSKHLLFSYQTTERIFSHKLIVFPLVSYAYFAALQSRIHDAWTWLLSSTFGETLNYSASDCFETFPFPNASLLSPKSPLERIGKQLYEARTKFMVETEQGLTKTYNALKDPDCQDTRIVQLREMHEEMDRAVLTTYGWDDISVPAYGTPTTPEEEKALQDFSEEVIDRLFVLNAKQAGNQMELWPDDCSKQPRR